MPGICFPKIFVPLLSVESSLNSWVSPLGEKLHSKAWEKYPCIAGNTFPSWRKEKLFWVVYKSFLYQQWVFFRIKKERFQRNPGILLTFLIIYSYNSPKGVPQSTSFVT
jgi:hypothetical protein